MKKFKYFFPLVLGMLLSAFVQAQDGATPHKWGVGIGYYATPTVGDSIRPFELSVNYKLSDKQTLYVSVPVSYHQYKLRDYDDKTRQALWGIGVGYKQDLSQYRGLQLFWGASFDFQKYTHTYRSLSHTVRADTNAEVAVLEKHDKEYRMFHLSPYVGTRFSINGFSIEPTLSLQARYYRHYVYSSFFFFSSIYSSHPDENKNGFMLTPLLKIQVSYYF